MIQTKTHRSLFTLLVAGAMLAAGCSKDEPFDFYAAHPDAVRFGVTIGQAPDTRANTEGDGTTFNPLDRIAISANGGTTYSTYELPATGDNWLPASGSRYIKWTEQSLSFQAYYPVTDGTSYTSFTLPEDQSTLEVLRSADYMKATTTAQTAGQPVALTFEHQLAKVTVKLTKGEQAENLTISSVKIVDEDRGLYCTYIIPYQMTGEDTYTAIINPRDAKPDKKFIEVTVNPSANFYLTGVPLLEKGKAYTLNLQVGHDGLKLGGITVEDWNAKDMTGGIAPEDLTVWDGTYPANDAEAIEWMGPESAGANDTDGRNHVFTITSARQLAALHRLTLKGIRMSGNFTNYDGYRYASYKLAADIDLNNHPWIPIGEGSGYFMGIFDGQGHTIRGMNITGDYIWCGFFGIVGNECVVKHLNVKGKVAPEITPDDWRNEARCGGIAGMLQGYTNLAHIAFCSFEGTIATTFDKTVYAGGIVGILGKGQILSCYSVTDMTLSGTGTHAKGGIAGEGSNGTTIKGCYWQELTGVTAAIGSGTPTLADNYSFTDAAGANVAVGAMNAATPVGYDYQWQAGSPADTQYPVLVPKVP